MLSRHKPLAALAAVTTTLAVAVPVAGASAASSTAVTVDPTVCQLMNTPSGPFGGLTNLPGGLSLENTLAHARSTVGCPAPTAASGPSLMPFPVFGG